MTEWAAFEKKTGPLGSRYSDDALANIHEQLQRLTHMTGLLFVAWAGGENPAPDPEPFKRPNQVYLKADPDDEDSDDDDWDSEETPVRRRDPDDVGLEGLIAEMNRREEQDKRLRS